MIRKLKLSRTTMRNLSSNMSAPHEVRRAPAGATPLAAVPLQSDFTLFTCVTDSMGPDCSQPCLSGGLCETGNNCQGATADTNCGCGLTALGC